MKTVISNLLCLIAMTVTLNSTSKTQTEMNLRNVMVQYYDKPLNQETLASAIVETEISHTEIVYRQAMLESGYLRSNLCKRHHNIFGMKHPRRRKTTSNGKTKSGYATFPSWIHSVVDYKYWQLDRKIDCLTDYLSYLQKNRYSTNPKYTSKLKGIFIPKNVKQLLVNT